MLSNCGAGKDSWESPLTVRISNQSILKEITPEYSLGGLMLKLQCFGHLMHRFDSLEKTPMLGKTEGRRRRRERMRRLDSTINNEHETEQTPEGCERQGCLECCSPWCHKELDTTEWLNWTERTCSECFLHILYAVVKVYKDLWEKFTLISH